MRRVSLISAALAMWAAPAAAQFLGMPVWNSPKGGSGISVYGDVGFPNSEYGEGTAFGARGSVGFGSLGVSAGLVTWEPKDAGESVLSYGGQITYRILGGALLPVSLNVQGSVGWSDAKAGLPKSTRAIGAVGVGANLPFLGVEVYASPSIRYTDYGDLDIPGLPTEPGSNETNFGMAIGASARLGLVGAHLAYDFENTSGGTVSVIGLGVSLGFHVPGM